MKRRWFSMILAIMVLFTSVDICAFALEIDNEKSQERNDVGDYFEEIEKDNNKTLAEENILLQSDDEIVATNFSSVPTYYGYLGNGGNYSSGCYIYSIAMLLQNSGISMTPAQVYADNSNDVYINSWGDLNTKYKKAYKVQITDRVYISGNYNEKLAEISAALDTYPTGIMIGFDGHMAYAFKLNGEVRVHDPANYHFENVDPDKLCSNRTIADCIYYRALTGEGVVKPQIYHNPYGVVDWITGGEGYIDIRGWVFDEDVPTESLKIHVYIGGPSGSGAPCYQFTANHYRSDVGREYPGIGDYHGYREIIYTNKSGDVDVYIYGINGGEGGTNAEIGHGTVNVIADTTAPEVINKYVKDVNKDGYTVIAEATDNVRVTSVKFPTWRTNDQTGGDALWYEGVKQEDGTWMATINTKDFGDVETTYQTHVYAYDDAENTKFGGSVSQYIDRTNPTISDVMDCQHFFRQLF